MSAEECALRITERIWLRSAQIQPNGWTSDTLGTLSEMLARRQNVPKSKNI